jgi:hypothetical protein
MTHCVGSFSFDWVSPFKECAELCSFARVLRVVLPMVYVDIISTPA